MKTGDGVPDFCMTFGDPDFVAYAKRASVTAPVDYSENRQVLVDELRANASTDVAERSMKSEAHRLDPVSTPHYRRCSTTAPTYGRFKICPL